VSAAGALTVVSWPRRLLDAWLAEHVRDLLRHAKQATANLGERVLPNGATLPALDTDYKRARHALAKRLKAAAEVFRQPVTPAEWSGLTEDTGSGAVAVLEEALKFLAAHNTTMTEDRIRSALRILAHVQRKAS
jgi:hypothetical protein